MLYTDHPTLAPLQGLLEVTRLARAASALPDLLAAVARVVSDGLGFGTSVVNLHRPEWDDFLVTTVHGGDEEGRAALLHSSSSSAWWARLLDPAYERGGAYFVPAGSVVWPEADDGAWYVPVLGPGAETIPPEERWDPEDALFVPLRTAGGELVGILSVDEPVDGRRPSRERLEVLGAVGAQLALAIEEVQTRQAAEREALAVEHLLTISAQLTEELSAASLLRAVGAGVRRALGFERSDVLLADRASGRLHRTGSPTEEAIALPTGLGELRALLDPALEAEGCFLLEAEEAAARWTGPRRRSPRNGRGPLAWQDHLLLVPLHDRRGAVTGVLVVDDPSDRRRPSRRILQTLRVFANQASAALDSAVLDAQRQAVERFRQTFENAPIGMAVADTRDGRLLEVNRALGATLGRSQEELVGTTYVELAHPEDRRATVSAAGRLADGHELVEEERRFLRGDGSTVHLQISASPLRDAAGRPTRAIAQLRDLTARRRAEAALRDSEARNGAMLASALDCVVAMDEEGRILEFNPAAERTFGYARAEVLGRDLAELIIPPEFRQRHRRGIARIGDGAANAVLDQRVEVPALRADGSTFLAEVAVTAIEEDGRRVYSAYLRDVSERARAERAVREERDRAQQYLDVAGTMFVVLDLDGRVAVINPKGCAVLGRSEQELLGADWFATVVPEAHRDAARATFAGLRAGDGAGVAHRESPVRTPTGSLRTIAWHHVVIRDEQGTITGVLGSGEDITERRRGEERLAYLAYHDKLTGLPNRAQLELRLADALGRAEVAGRAVAVLALDLALFKLVNDSLGHAAGDELLRLVGQRLRPLVARGDVLARPGGDEFMVVCGDLPGDGRPDAQAVAELLGLALRAPFRVAGVELHLEASIGISVFPADAGDAEALLSHAEAAMYRAKQAGRGGFRFHEAELEHAAARLALITRLRHAVPRGELELHYQPIVRLRDGNINGMEALVRWRDRDGTLVPPGAFIPLAEQIGLIEPIGHWVAHEAALQARRWRDQGLDVHVGFNVSPRELQRTDVAATVRSAAEAAGLDPSVLTVEVTEGALQTDPGRADRVLAELDALGCKLAIDDFGADHSSLARLRDLPFGVLKLDRAFLRGIPEDPGAGEIVSAIVGLGSALGMATVVEGVETPEQEAFVRACGSLAAQGFHFARPLDVGAATALLRQHPRTRVAA